MFKPPDLHSMAQEPGCLKTEHFTIEKTEIVGFFHQKEKTEMHWFPADLPTKGHCVEIIPNQRQQHAELKHNSRLTTPET